jgi:uncharacterized protein YjbI with pentapeptide repeats
MSKISQIHNRNGKLLFEYTGGLRKALEEVAAAGTVHEDVVLRHRNLPKADLRKIELSYADLVGTDFRSANMAEAVLDGADCTGANFSRAQLRDAMLDHSNFTAADGYRADFSYTHCHHVNFATARLNRANFRGAHCSWTHFDLAQLRGADFTSATCRAQFQYADLQNACFNGAKLDGANFASADLSGASFNSGSTLSGTNFASADLYGATYNGKPILRILQFGGIGSAGRSTTVVVLRTCLHIFCGCKRFCTLKAFAETIDIVYADSSAANPQYREEYHAAIRWLKDCIDAARTYKV